MSRADWELVKVDHERKIVFIKDLDQGNVSVTNDAEDVTQEVMHDYPDDYRLFYQDSMGDWDELVHNNKGVFTGFKFGNGMRP